MTAAPRPLLRLGRKSFRPLTPPIRPLNPQPLSHGPKRFESIPLAREIIKKLNRTFEVL